jgi:hypothetical protein
MRMGADLISMAQNKTPEELILRCRNCLPVAPAFFFGAVVGRLNSECPQQNRANENEHGAHSQHIQSQGKVHEVPPLLVCSNVSIQRKLT